MNGKVLAIYPGSFNPFHLGHKNIADKTFDIFGAENTTIAIGLNPSKLAKMTDKEREEYLNAVKKRVAYLKTKLPCDVIYFDCYLHELVAEKENEGYKVVIIKGLRNGDDLAYEDTQIRYVKDFNKNVRFLFFRGDPEFDHISSSFIRQIEEFRKGDGARYIV